MLNIKSNYLHGAKLKPKIVTKKKKINGLSLEKFDAKLTIHPVMEN